MLPGLMDELDIAVAAAYGWPADLLAAAIVARVVALNLVRQLEEAEGRVRWLRPEFQAPAEQRRAAQGAMAVEQAADATLPPWPARDPDRFVALRSILAVSPGRPAELSRRFSRTNANKVRDMLETLTALGQARLGPDGRVLRVIVGLESGEPTMRIGAYSSLDPMGCMNSRAFYSDDAADFGKLVVNDTCSGLILDQVKYSPFIEIDP